MIGTVKTIDMMIEERSLLKHPFYKMWSEGTLTMSSLSGYSMEYFQLVKAIPEFMSCVIDGAPANLADELIANRNEEREHIDLWINFAGRLGVGEEDLLDHTGLAKTKQAIDNLYTLMSSCAEGASAMYALEKEIPKISQTKLDGLAEFYGITEYRDTEYFRLHTEADIRHAASWQRVLDEDESDEATLLQAAERSISAQHLLLDGCYEAYCTVV